ncbi:MAG TPA: bifunctional serine/threonine-protein kinase/formylglycine-generating enzyme family protein [Bacteroidia bacterium]|nr:bifunctional serine/threonine-protein kinase/formylglycine-generating enzyme family protein [Bacteroidia bacterium]
MNPDAPDPSSDPPFDADATLPYERPASPAPKAPPVAGSDSLADSPHIAEISPVELLRRGLQSRPTSGAVGPWTPPQPEELARLLPQYQIESFLGRGGMGAVYKGRQTALDRPVAIKLLPAEMAADDSFIVRFQREAQTLARLQHPGIVAVYDFGQTGEGHLYFVMEYVDGTDLQRLLHGPGLSEGQSLEIVSQVCDALQYAHSQGVVHRDIKPANILVTADGRAKLADFGLARPLHDDGFSLTRSNVVMGTPDYMAPEQLYGTPDHRADLFSLGVMLYEMLTGRPPRGSWLAPSQRVQVDVRLDDVVVRALAEDPELRYQQASEIKSDVDRIRTTEIELPVPVPVPETASGSRAGNGGRGEGGKGRKAIIPAVAVLLLAGIGGAVLWQKGSAGTPARNESGDAVAPPQSAQDADKSVRAPVADPKAATKDSPFLNSLGMKFVPVPGTDVLFCIHETRRKDYAAYAEENPGIDNQWKTQTQTIDGWTIAERAEDHPATRVSWEDAQAFCEWIGRKEGRTYRLPTDEEWSFAVGLAAKETRSPGDTPQSLSQKVTDEYPWGKAWPPPPGGGNYSDRSRLEKAPSSREDARYLEGYDDGFPTTAPVMSFAPNTFGLYDVGGNVREWLGDWYNAAQELRVLRGGSWLSGTEGSLRSSYRSSDPPTARYHDYGFRLILVPDAPAPVPPKPEPPTTTNPKEASKDRPFVNGLGMKFVPVPGTDALFCIHETRYKDYAAYAKENPGGDGAWKIQSSDSFIVTDRNEDHPVWLVSWEDAKAFCEWISKKEGRAYRLPTDAEWSIAVGLGGKEQRSPDDTPESLNNKVVDEYPWGTEWPPPVGTGNFSDQSRKEKAPRKDPTTVYLDYDDGFPATAPVMSFPPNAFGLYDMAGNMAEWVEDWYNAEQKGRATRGSAWSSELSKFLFRSSTRNHAPPDSRVSASNGFRLVLVPDAPTAAPPKPEPPTTTNPKEASKERPFANSLGMKFVPVPGIDALFCIHETRYRDYAAFAEKNPGTAGAWKNQSQDGYTITDRNEDHPVWRVSWEHAQSFCRWLSQVEGRVYRLPTDREWSFAVGIGEREQWAPGDTPQKHSGQIRDEYPWGTEWPPPPKVANFLQDLSRQKHAPKPGLTYLEGYDDGFPLTSPVMSFPPNRFGIHDLAGNVIEWVEDWVSDQKDRRTLRGAGNDRVMAMFGTRMHHIPTDNHHYCGFRVVLDPTPTKPE